MSTSLHGRWTKRAVLAATLATAGGLLYLRPSLSCCSSSPVWQE